MVESSEQKNYSDTKIAYILKGDIRTLSKTRITARKILSHLQQQLIVLTVELERQHGNRPLYSGPLHLDLEVYFISALPIYRQTKLTKSTHEKYCIIKPYISILVGLIERIGEKILFNDGTYISSVSCFKKYTVLPEPYLSFTITELKEGPYKSKDNQ
jgi:hypothetical protein